MCNNIPEGAQMLYAMYVDPISRDHYDRPSRPTCAHEGCREDAVEGAELVRCPEHGVAGELAAIEAGGMDEFELEYSHEQLALYLAAAGK